MYMYFLQTFTLFLFESTDQYNTTEIVRRWGGGGGGQFVVEKPLKGALSRGFCCVQVHFVLKSLLITCTFTHTQNAPPES